MLLGFHFPQHPPCNCENNIQSNTKYSILKVFFLPYPLGCTLCSAKMNSKINKSKLTTISFLKSSSGAGLTTGQLLVKLVRVKSQKFSELDTGERETCSMYVLCCFDKPDSQAQTQSLIPNGKVLHLDSGLLIIN